MTAKHGMKVMKKRGGWLAASVLGALLLLLLGTAPALAADRWSDITDSEWEETYGISVGQAATVAEGLPDGSFLPGKDVTRGQFAKMAVDGLGIGTADPEAMTFTDVLRDHTFFVWIEGGVKSGVISGYPDGTYKPSNSMSRQQCNNILGAHLSDEEIADTGGIMGSSGTYPTLAAWFLAEGDAVLALFDDRGEIADVHRPGTAYLVMRGVVLGSDSGELKPGNTLIRAQAVAMIVRAKAKVGAAYLPLTSLQPSSGPASGGNQVIINGDGFIDVTEVRFGDAVVPESGYIVDPSGTKVTVKEAPAGTGTVRVQVTTPVGTTADSAAARYTYVAGSTVPGPPVPPGPPRVTINQAVGQKDPTNASPIAFSVVFSRPVTGFDADGVQLSGTAGATTAEVTGSGTTYDVAVSGMTGTGTVIATVPAEAAVAVDDGTPSLASSSTDNIVTYDVTPPTVTIDQAVGQADPTSTSPVDFTVVFSKPVTGFVSADVSVTGTAGGVKTATVTGSGATYNVAVSGMTTSGTIIASIVAGVAQDAAGNMNSASTSTDNQVTWNEPVVPQTLSGFVIGNLEGERVAGAHVTVDRESDGLLLGEAFTDASGNYTIDMTGVSLGTEVLVQVTAPGYGLVGMVGAYNKANLRVEFRTFDTPSSSDRRLPFGEDTMPAPPFRGLWPG